ncbi:tryptophan--tRNA ligase [Patescibacteria group bacterium]
MKKRVFSGTRATGRLHIGNYFGAIKGYIDLQNNKDLDCVYMVVDLHSITTPFTPGDLTTLTKHVVLDYLGAGLDPEKSLVTLQSLVPEHAYLSWLFSAVVSTAQLQHLPTFKEKVKQHPENVNLALLSYPVLMAADILIYKAEFVPVGVDQMPHIEIARDIARRVNKRFGTKLPVPERFATPVSYVPSLSGIGKMSKSVGDSIFLVDSLDDIKKKVAGIPTNSGKGTIETEEKENHVVKIFKDEKGVEAPGLAPLFGFVEMFQGKDKMDEYEAAYKDDGVRFGDLKKALASAIYKELEPIQERRAEYESNDKLVDEILMEGAKKSRKIAGETLAEMQEAYGFYQPGK